MNSIAKYKRSDAKVVVCNADPCSSYVSNNSIENTFNMGLVTLNIVGNESVSKTLTIYSNTSSEQLFTATWNIDDSLYNDAPTAETDWNAFKSAYVTAGGGRNELTIDLEQWAADNGSVFGGEDHSFTITSFCNSSECQSNLYSNTISVEVLEDIIAFELITTEKSSSSSMDVGTILGINDLRFNNENDKLIDYTSVSYSWQDDNSNVISTSPRLPLNMSDVGKNIYLKVNASDYAGNVMSEKVYDFGTVTNTAALTEHLYDKRDEVMFWDFSQEITGDYLTPSNTNNPAYSFSDINGEHKMVNVNTSSSYSNVNFDPTENGFLKKSRKLQFPKPIGQRDYFFLTFTVRFQDGATDDSILDQYLQLAGVDFTSLFIWHDTSQNRINLGSGSGFRLGGVVDAQWVTYTLMWLDNTPTSNSVIKIIATQGGSSLTPITVTSSSVPTLDLQTRMGVSASSNVKTTFFRSSLVDVKHIILPKMTGTLLTEAEIITIHNQAHNAI